MRAALWEWGRSGEGRSVWNWEGGRGKRGGGSGKLVFLRGRWGFGEWDALERNARASFHARARASEPGVRLMLFVIHTSMVTACMSCFDVS
jgi:hypothetical protein